MSEPGSSDPPRLRDVYAVVGNPVAHSLSPTIHAAFAAQTGEAVHYTRVLCPVDGFEATLREFAAREPQPAQGLGRSRGCNVTVPFKLLAPALARRVSERAALAGAANVLRFDDGSWFADNTDGIGLVRDIEQHARWPLEGRRVLLVGAGGAAAGVLGPLIERRPALLVLANRSRDKAAALATRHAGVAAAHGVALEVAGLDRPGLGFDLFINASTSSLQGAPPPVPPEVLREGSLAVDLMYGLAAQGFLEWARAHGALARDGLGMLVEQAAEAFFVWRGVRPDGAVVLADLRRQLKQEG